MTRTAIQDPMPLTRLFDLADRALQRFPVWLGAILVLAVLQTALIFTHQPWADELQALLIALEAPDQKTLLTWLRYEGHPPLWYWVLQAVGTVMPQEAVLPVAAFLCAIAVQGVILFFSPFTRTEKLLLASSQYVLFEFLTISRGTSLGVALLAVAMVGWKKRWFWLVMALLPMVDFLFGVISGVFLLLKWREKDLWWPGIVLWLTGSAFAAWSILPAPDMVSASEAMAMQSGLSAWLLKLGSLPIPFQGGIAPQWNTPVVPIAGFAWILMLALCWMLTRGQAWQRLLIFGFFGFTLAFSLAVYPIGLRHLMLGAFLLILMVWLQRAGEDGAASGQRAIFGSWLAVLSLCGLVSSGLSTVRGFDSAPRALAEIERLGLTDKHWIALPEWRTPALSGRSDMVFSRPEGQCAFTFVRWDHKSAALESPEALTAMLESEIARNGRTYLLSDMKFNGFPPDLIAPLAEIPAGYGGIEYRLYVVGRDIAEKPVVLTPCHAVGPKQKPLLP